MTFTFYYSMTLKQKIYKHYLQAIQDKAGDLQKVLADLKESGANETKSTAGDKHETALAMLQIEQSNIRGQLKEMQQQLAALEKINPAIVPAVIVLGSLIKTNKGYLFLSIAAGKAVIEGHTVLALSPQSPLGQQLVNATKSESVTINNTTYTIENIE
jgi:transcription elongation GreA/GreB family factor